MSVVPSFFIIGGPRCGTSALRSYLGEHPNALLPGPPEPHFFCSDLRVEYQVTSFEEYLELFAEAREWSIDTVFIIKQILRVWYSDDNRASGRRL
jgi:hypothetical protein